MSSEQIRVLIVEDHKLTRIGLKAILKQVADIDVVGEAVNGQEAVDMVRETHPDVVLMDVGMPVMDGIEAVKIIHDQFKKVNTIML
ncbi:MAG TPA: response regulator transcription factor, partial [Candidatus Melainabacteria bacterium]|nr:response regulator transcription factor [Candidatus Melainabacteria bacterium]